MSYIRTGAPRNTSNGDYGRFLFTPNMASPGLQNNGYYSSNGQRMVQHVHYPNCPNRNGPGQNQGPGGNPMQDYTIEYGEDAVRAALGGHMPDFQAEFQKQYGSGNTGGGGGGAAGGPSIKVDPQAIQMMNNGKSKVAMIPVVLTTEGDENQKEVSPASDSNNNAPSTPTTSPPQQTETDCAPSQTASENTSQSQAAEASPTNEQPQLGATMTYKKENLNNAFESVRKARSSGQVKYGRHVRPSYWKPEVPNPCRKKVMGMGGGSGDTTCDIGNNNAEDVNNMHMQECNSAGAYPMDGGNEMMMMNQNGYFMPQQQQQATQPQMVAPNMQQPQIAYQQRTRSLPPKKTVRPTYSLCGKCRKCKNLSSENPEASILTFPKYANGGFQRQSQTMTSSNLGQSAKNFRAIRFSSHHM